MNLVPNITGQARTAYIPIEDLRDLIYSGIPGHVVYTEGSEEREFLVDIDARNGRSYETRIPAHSTLKQALGGSVIVAPLSGKPGGWEIANLTDTAPTIERWSDSDARPIGFGSSRCLNIVVARAFVGSRIRTLDRCTRKWLGDWIGLPDGLNPTSAYSVGKTTFLVDSNGKSVGTVVNGKLVKVDGLAPTENNPQNPFTAAGDNLWYSAGFALVNINRDGVQRGIFLEQMTTIFGVTSLASTCIGFSGYGGDRFRVGLICDRAYWLSEDLSRLAATNALAEDGLGHLILADGSHAGLWKVSPPRHLRTGGG